MTTPNEAAPATAAATATAAAVPMDAAPATAPAAATPAAETPAAATPAAATPAATTPATVPPKAPVAAPSTATATLSASPASAVSPSVTAPVAKRARTGNERLRLSTGQDMPTLGLGTWQATDPKELHAAIVEAVDTHGYRHIDCASIYGNEVTVGAALKEVFERGKVKRADMFIVSKLWNTHHHPDHVRPAIEQTLKDLQLDYLDLYLIHWPVAFEFTGIPTPPNQGVPKDDKGYIKFAKVPLQDTWKALETLVDAGLTKSIGLSNWRLVDILDLLTYARIQPAVNQIESHPYFTRKELIDECRRFNIQVVAFSPFGGAGPAAKKGPLNERTIQRFAKKHNKTTAQIILRWQLQRHCAVIPKTVHSNRLKENMDIFDFELSEREVDEIEAINRDYSFIDMRQLWGYPISV